MNQKDTDLNSQNDDLMKEVGKLDLLTKELKEATEEEEEDRQDISDWITSIGKAILAIFK